MDSIERNSIEKKISKDIFIFPIITIGIFTIMVSISLFFYLNNFKNKRVKDLKQELISQRKELIKGRVNELIKDISNITKNARYQTKQDIKNRVENISVFANKLVKYNSNLSKKELKRIFIEMLNAERYNNGNGYFFAYDRNTGEIKAHAIKIMIGKNTKNCKTKNGDSSYKKIERVLKRGKGSGYFSLYFQKPNQKTDRKFEKIDYIKYIKQLNLVIGTGEYVEDMKQKIQQHILKRIQHKTYGRNRYFWVNTSKGILLAHPYLKNKIGKNIINLKDANGKKFVKLFIKAAKANPNGAFVSYYWKNPATGEVGKKISFVRYFKEWNCIIGEGTYIKDLNKLTSNAKIKLQKQMLYFILIVFLIVFISILLSIVFSIYFSKNTKHLFENYRDELHKKIEEAVSSSIKKDKLLQQQSKLASMGEMIGAIAHQWRQPLNSLAINIQNLEDDYDDGLVNKSFLEKFSDKNMKTIQFMSKTIDDFRNFFRVDKEKQIFSIQKAIEEVISIQEVQLKSKNIKLNITGGDFEIEGYKSEFKQAILNIISNAKEALDDKKIKDKFIDIRLHKGVKEIEIEDNAKGVPNGIKNRIFEPYFTTKEIGHGTGIGLYMSKLIIDENMHGKLTFYNSSNGAVFVLKFHKNHT